MTADCQLPPDAPVMPLPRAQGCPLLPPPEFERWRETAGLRRVSWRGRDTWVISRYEDIRAALPDPRLSADTIPAAMGPAGVAEMPQIFPRMDDPEHQWLRRMMTREFAYRRCEAMRPQIQDLVDDIVDRMIAKGPPADIEHDFALPVPSLVICLLLGVPYEDHEFFQHHSTVGLDMRSTNEEKGAAQGALFVYMSELLDRKERDPGDDLLSRLLTDYVATGELQRATAVMNGLIMLQAGHETTASMISLGTLALLQHPDHFARLRTAAEADDQPVLANIVEELMRYLSIVHSLVDRVAVDDVMIGGQLVREGEWVLMNLPAGNFDPAFVDDPGTFDIDRSARGHLGFGFGVHQCIGANLARVELQVAFATLARRLPGLRLAVPADELRFQNEQEIYGIEQLPVTW